VPGYLLDTNHISAWEEQHPVFLARFNAEPAENIIWVCPISLGELECGMRITPDDNPARRAACRRFIEENVLNFVHPIDVTTRDSYAMVMQRIWNAHRPAHGGIDTQRHLSTLGVDINDAWIAAVAIEHGLILLTTDAMATIRACVPELNVQNWTV
jgi:tRNA(fMet)-specific endonuclease VapC